MAGGFLVDNLVQPGVSLGGGTFDALMPAENLHDPQPRRRLRILGSSGSVQIVFAGSVSMDCIFLGSTNLTPTAQVRGRLTGGTGGSGEQYYLLDNVTPYTLLDGTPYTTLSSGATQWDTGTLNAQTGDDARGQVVLTRSSPASGTGLIIDVSDSSLSYIDIGIVAAGRLTRVGRGMTYGAAEGRRMLGRRVRNPITGAEFAVPAPAGDPRGMDFELSMASDAASVAAYRSMIYRTGAARDVLYIPELTDSLADRNQRSIWGGINLSGGDAMAVRPTFALMTRRFSLTERL